MKSYDVSTSAEFGPLAGVLSVLLEHAGNHGVETLLIGAAARDVLIRQATGALPERATADVDIAVAVADWADYRRLTAALVPIGSSGHSFRVEGVEVDVVPFGGVESAGRTITWPSDHVMNTNGFREALVCAVVVLLPGGVVIRVASLPAQVVLKLHAWRDRRMTTTRDAIDLRTILLAFGAGSYLDELYTDWSDVLPFYDFDPQLAGAHRMGVEIRRDLGSAIADDCRHTIGTEAAAADRLRRDGRHDRTQPATPQRPPRGRCRRPARSRRRCVHEAGTMI